METETETETDRRQRLDRGALDGHAAAIGPVKVAPAETETGTDSRDRDRRPTEGRDRMSTETETDPGTETAPPAPSAARTAIAAQLTGRTNRLFYFVVLAVALVGSSTAAREWLLGNPEKGETASWWFLPLALVAVAVYELGAVAISRFADQRRQLGERAVIARAASAALAAGAIAAQLFGHWPDLGPAVFFAGVSLTGYVIYLLEAAANRRDALRRDSKLADTPPAYGIGQWFRHPGLTRRARALALANAENRLQDKSLATLGRVASLTSAVEQVRAEKRLAAIEDALRTRIAAGVDPTMAKIAVNTYDMPTVAAGIAAAADYPALTRIITAELVPARLVKLGDAEDQGTTTAAAAITEKVTTAVAALTETAPAGLPPAPAAELTQLPLPAAETAPVPASVPAPPAPAETETAPVPAPAETARAAAETAPPAWRLEPVPPPLASIRAAASPAPSVDPVPLAAAPETAPVPAAAVVPPAPPVTETEASPAIGRHAADQGGTDGTDDETDGTETNDVLAGVEDKLVPLMLKVIEEHGNWAHAVLMPPRHADALNVPKIMTAAGTGSKAYGVRIGQLLREFATTPETVEAALRSRGLVAADAG